MYYSSVANLAPIHRANKVANENAPAPAPAPLRITVTEFMNLRNVSLQVTDLEISYNCCNDLISLDLNKFQCLRSLEIGVKCFESVETFAIDGLHQLRTLKIGMNSFTKAKDFYGNDESKSFHILNCELLESIEIDKYCFSDFAGDFELKNLPSLRSISIGRISKPPKDQEDDELQSVIFYAFNENWSFNFYCSSFVIRGSDVILYMLLLDLPNLQSITLGNCVFDNSLTTIIESIDV